MRAGTPMTSRSCSTLKKNKARLSAMLLTPSLRRVSRLRRV